MFSSVERTAYNLIIEGVRASEAKPILRQRYCVANARWLQSAINQGNAVAQSQEEGIKQRIELYREKIRNTGEKMKRISNPLKIGGCEAKIGKLQSKLDESKRQLNEKSYPKAIYGSKKLFHKLSIAKSERRGMLVEEWREKRSNHFFSVGQANQRGNGNTRLIQSDDKFYLEIRNWFDEDDYRIALEVPDEFEDVLKVVIGKAQSVKLGRNGEVLKGGLAYSVRVVRCEEGYQVFVSFEFEEPAIVWTGRIAGVDINPEGIGCSIVSNDGNLIATRFFRENRLVSSSSNKRKRVLENLVNRMLRWCRANQNCNAVAIEDLSFTGGYDFYSALNFKLSNFMRRKMLDLMKLHAMKMNMLSVEVDPRYTSKVAITKYGEQFGGFNRHQLAAFVIGRRALGYGEAPVMEHLPRTKREKRMWNYCLRNYGYPSQIQTLFHHEPMEWKSDGDVNGGERITKLLIARPTNTSSRGLGHHAPMTNRTGAVQSDEASGRRVGSVRPNRHSNGGDGARGDRVNPPPPRGGVSNLLYYRRYG